jgi:hypothetical protein
MLVKAYIIILAAILCFSVLTARSQGLLFKSEDSLLTQRTSLHIFDTHPPVFHFPASLFLSSVGESICIYVANYVLLYIDHHFKP